MNFCSFSCTFLLLVHNQIHANLFTLYVLSNLLEELARRHNASIYWAMVTRREFSWSKQFSRGALHSTKGCEEKFLTFAIRRILLSVLYGPEQVSTVCMQTELGPNRLLQSSRADVLCLRRDAKITPSGLRGRHSRVKRREGERRVIICV